jgi:hypothetical protein
MIRLGIDKAEIVKLKHLNKPENILSVLAVAS